MEKEMDLKEMKLGSDRNVHLLGYGEPFTGVYIGQISSNYTL